jgi:hypothetical protein
MHAELADGTTATADFMNSPFAAAGLSNWIGGGGGGRWDQDYWLWPLPADGKVRIRLEIAGLGIEGAGVLDLGGDVEALAAHARALL